MIISPPNLRFDLSPDKNLQTENIKLEFKGLNDQIQVEFSDFTNVDFNYTLEENVLHVTTKLISYEIGEFEGRLFITHNQTLHQIPIHIRVTEATINIIEENGKLSFEILKPLEWTYAKITAINNKTLEKNSISFSPENNQSLNVYQSGNYWIEVNITTDENTFDVYDTIFVNSYLENDKKLISIFENIERPVLILIVIIIIVALFGVKILKN